LIQDAQVQLQHSLCFIQLQYSVLNKRPAAQWPVATSLHTTLSLFCRSTAANAGMLWLSTLDF
jgi:hypothetical protein